MEELDPNSLVTSYEQTRAGFLKLALEKNRQSTPYVQEAKALKQEVLQYQSPQEILKHKEIHSAVLSASGLSDKSLAYLSDKDKQEAIEDLIEKYLEPAGKDFVDELIFRYLLTKGDSLGGKMRNIAGNLGQYELIRKIIANLSIKNIPFYWLNNETRCWIKGEYDDENIEYNAKGLSWGKDNPRTLMFNLNVPLVKKNVDICLFDKPKDGFEDLSSNNNLVIEAQNYLLLGELKGGIDPAGADEHWKTARSALIGRILTKFNSVNLHPYIIFIGAAIEKAMAEEICSLILSKQLSKVANLTSEEQMHSICSWLISI